MSRNRTASPSKPSAAALLAWYDRHRRVLPWRAPPGVRPDPYRVWLSEVMLQQTTAKTVMPRFENFVARWPDVRALAASPLDAVLHEWQGLGYYARARNLHACAVAVVADHDGEFPADEDALRQLPGIGDYTAAAIAAIAFDAHATPVDGNVERVMARLHRVTDPLPGAKPELRRLAAALTPARRTGDYAQAVMDLGATLCVPKQPRCMSCPWRNACRGHADGSAERLPARRATAARPLRQGVAFWVERDDGAVLLRRRPERGLLGGMMELPSTAWRAAPWGVGEAKAQAPIAARWRRLPNVVRHVFTHFELELAVMAARVEVDAEAVGVWVQPGRLGDHALPTVMKKVIAHARRGGR